MGYVQFETSVLFLVYTITRSKMWCLSLFFLTGSIKLKHKHVLKLLSILSQFLTSRCLSEGHIAWGVGVFFALGKGRCQGVGQLTVEPVGKELVSLECSEETQ